ncbi:cytochrome P450 9e2-like [Ostrinia furnacalis]|uniref:unspecific monooxygenase n=1 Tax=Ostrinia furnacalis TaxID=93504 RepID=A0A7S9GM46_OSTFU|nr:cytochrome P450 9e2-like [Ostrinia furnacalis]QPF77612.1 cytochrome P450 monooxygenase CYP9A185 [Ostrinia furnacalis]
MLLYIWIAVIIAAVWLYCRHVFSKFTKSGVKHFKPIPLFGNMAKLLFRYEHFADAVTDLYQAFPEERFVGRYEFMNPAVMIRDIELLKKVTVKDFEYFLDHRSLVNEKTDPFFGRNLFSLKGQEWKDMRSTLSPAFTSSKMRLMVPFMVEVGDQMIDSLQKKIEETKEGYIDIDCKDLTTRYANDVIASCAFGLKVNSMKDENNEFYTMGKVAANFSIIQIFLLFIMISVPKVSEKLKLKLFSEKTGSFFKNLVLGTMLDRQQRNIIRPDMIHLLMEAKKGKLVHDEKAQDADAGFATVEESSIGKKTINKTWTDEDLIAQAILFFVAGFETVSSAMSFALHELAVNPDVQDKLVEEIRENDARNNGKFDYNSIQNMPYMDMVVSEVLRLWPPAIATDRMCIKDYNLGKPNSKATEDYYIRKGEAFAIPIWAFHRDPEFFPNPNKFDPERFSEENKHKIQPFTYMPFGLGPRNCIGSRFALCEVKVMLYQLLLHVELSPAAKTCIPAELARDTFNLRLKGGHWIRMKTRKSN